MTALENYTLADFTSTALIIPKLHTTRPAEVMQELGDVLHRENEAIPVHLLGNLSALNHELLTSLSLDFGAVFPKVVVPQLQRPRFALGRRAEPLPWRSQMAAARATGYLDGWTLSRRRGLPATPGRVVAPGKERHPP
jgi:hypothetical protein